VHHEGRTLGRRQRRASERREIELRNEQRPEQVGGLLTDASFRQVGDNDAPVVHGITKIELWRVLTQNGGTPVICRKDTFSWIPRHWTFLVQ
jgi:hypothetical protein